MADAKATASSGGIGFCSLLTIVLLVLKVLGHIGCSWWWVFAPIWIPPAVILAVLVLVGIVLGGAALLHKCLD